MILLTTEKIGKAAVVHAEGRIDAETAQQLEDACNAFIDAGETVLILDFSKVRYISSWGLRAILLTGKKLDAAGGRLIPCGLSAMLKEVFQISGFDSLFRSYPSLDAALASV